MTCKPTIGETRVFPCGQLRFVTDTKQQRCDCGNLCDPTSPGTILHVAPKNQARVTAGPTWMGAQ